MKHGLNYKMLVFWVMVNAVITICFGLLLAVICLFPDFAPKLRTILAEGTVASLLPYLIFILIVSSLLSLTYYYDSRGR